MFPERPARLCGACKAGLAWPGLAWPKVTVVCLGLCTAWRHKQLHGRRHSRDGHVCVCLAARFGSSWGRPVDVHVQSNGAEQTSAPLGQLGGCAGGAGGAGRLLVGHILFREPKSAAEVCIFKLHLNFSRPPTSETTTTTAKTTTIATTATKTAAAMRTTIADDKQSARVQSAKVARRRRPPNSQSVGGLCAASRGRFFCRRRRRRPKTPTTASKWPLSRQSAASQRRHQFWSPLRLVLWRKAI